MSVITLKDSTFEEEVLKSETPVLVDFWAEWCQPCKMVRPLVHELAEEFKDKIKVGEMDVDAEVQTAGKYGVMSIPTIAIFKNGKPVTMMIGVQSRDTYKEKINAAISS
ncbi:MAG TPA: thioredoxin [Patescibacteria group bacterium]|nr:thioredoxin [Patescibacteria group bacterium]